MQPAAGAGTPPSCVAVPRDTSSCEDADAALAAMEPGCDCAELRSTVCGTSAGKLPTASKEVDAAPTVRLNGCCTQLSTCIDKLVSIFSHRGQLVPAK